MPLTTPVDATFAALADATRRQVVESLRQGPKRAGELAAAAGMSAPALSRHLRVLRKSGIVEEQGIEEDARIRIYRLRRERFMELQAWLDEVEAFWSERLNAFKEHVERTWGGKSDESDS